MCVNRLQRRLQTKTNYCVRPSATKRTAAYMSALGIYIFGCLPGVVTCCLLVSLTYSQAHQIASDLKPNLNFFRFVTASRSESTTSWHVETSIQAVLQLVFKTSNCRGLEIVLQIGANSFVILSPQQAYPSRSHTVTLSDVRSGRCILVDCKETDWQPKLLAQFQREL